MLRIKGLVKRYRTGDLALKGVDLDVPDGLRRKTDTDKFEAAMTALGMMAGWRWTFAIVGMLAVLTMALVALFAPRDPAHPQQSTNERRAGGPSPQSRCGGACAGSARR